MKNKTKISKFFETLIYTILLALPLISVFARVIYTQSNNNAKDSYSDVTYSSPFTLTSSDEIIDGRVFDVSYHGSTDRSWTFGFTSIDLDFGDRVFNAFFLADTKVYFGFADWSSNTFTGQWTYGTWSSFNFTSDGNKLYTGYGSLTGTNNKFLFYIPIPITLDNAFDYGLQKTIDDFGIGNINFLNWFGTMFSNNTNLLYINFVNMYLNYALWVSVGYLLYYFLNWFIRFVRETLDRLIYKESNQ